MQRTFFKVALAALATCGLAGIASSTARAQGSGQFGTLVPIPQDSGSAFATPALGAQGGSGTYGNPPSFGGRGGGGMFSPAASAMFGTPVSQFQSTLQQFASGPLGDLQSGIHDAFGNPVTYDYYNGNFYNGSGPVVGWYPGGWGPGYVNYGGYLNNEIGYRGYSPYYGNNPGYGNNAGNGVNNEGVNPSAYGNDAPPAYYGNGSYTNGLNSNIYYTPTYAPANGAYGGNAAPVSRGALGWF
jgi:hypothetical protein